ncbi:hypothetical protein QQP08_007307 [Theobroma cacao]|nr:hypothetical protein QQP08_007307 [Theobroma cacao]
MRISIGYILAEQPNDSPIRSKPEFGQMSSMKRGSERERGAHYFRHGRERSESPTAFSDSIKERLFSGFLFLPTKTTRNPNRFHINLQPSQDSEDFILFLVLCKIATANTVFVLFETELFCPSRGRVGSLATPDSYGHNSHFALRSSFLLVSCDSDRLTKRELHRVYLLVSLINPRTPFPTLLGHKNKFTGQNRHLAYPHVLQNRRTGWLAINPCHVLKAEGYDREHYCRVLDTSKGRFLVGGVVYIANGRAVKSWILTARFFSTLFYLQGDSCF